MNSICRHAFALSLVLVAACAKSPEPVEIGGVLELEATVVAVDLAERIIELEGSAGNRVATRVGPEVRNLAEVEVGDTLKVSYYSGYVLAMAEPGQAGTDMGAVAGRAAEGERPAGLAATATTATVEILSVEKEGKSVSFRDSDGRVRSVPVYQDEAQAFAKRLKKGDFVDVRYTDALTVSIAPNEP